MPNFATSLLLSKTESGLFTASHSLHTGPFDNKDAAIGAAVASALKMKPGFAVADAIAVEITSAKTSAPAAQNAEIQDLLRKEFPG
jgi:hypothetical protein